MVVISSPSTHDIPLKLPDIIPLARTHMVAMLDTAWSPVSDTLVASASEDGTSFLWKVSDSLFDGWTSDAWEPYDLEPITRVEVNPRKVGQVLWHPTAANVLTTASSEHLVKLWDLADPSCSRFTLIGHGDTIQSLAFNVTGTILATTCRDKKLQLFDLVVWMGEQDCVASTGFSKMSDRQVGIWETGGLGNVKTLTINQSAGVIMPFWSNSGILFLDGNIQYYEYELDLLYSLTEHSTSNPQHEVSECEIARAFKVTSGGVEPIAFIVPCWADSFQSDIYPPVPSSEPFLTAAKFFAGKTAPLNLISLENDAVFAGNDAPPLPAAVSLLSPAPAVLTSTPISKTMFTPDMTKSTTIPSHAHSLPANTARVDPPGHNVHPCLKVDGTVRSQAKKIHNLELQVEGLKANTRKAIQTLMEG
ncbi:WD40-repeat-containing domain protein [Tylopilus felleus]